MMRHNGSGCVLMSPAVSAQGFKCLVINMLLSTTALLNHENEYVKVN